MKSIFYLLFLVSLTGCGKKHPQPEDFPEPGKAALSFPSKDALCTTGEVHSANEASITFSWEPSANTDRYELHLKNLLSGEEKTGSSSTNQLTLILYRNTPYQWSVSSKSSKSAVATSSENWKFYVAGPGTISYSPFPAALVSPSYGEEISSVKTSISLKWQGSDVDNDIKAYDIYFGTSLPLPLLKSGVSEMTLNEVSVQPGTTYFWKVITRDAASNSSDSETFQFKTDR